MTDGITRGANGNILTDGDIATLITDPKVKE